MTEDDRMKGMTRWSVCITESIDMNLSKLWEIVERGVWHATVHGVTKSQTQFHD